MLMLAGRGCLHTHDNLTEPPAGPPLSSRHVGTRPSARLGPAGPVTPGQAPGPGPLVGGPRGGVANYATNDQQLRTCKLGRHM
jgi:hypothetical protein